MKTDYWAFAAWAAPHHFGRLDLAAARLAWQEQERRKDKLVDEIGRVRAAENARLAHALGRVEAHGGDWVDALESLEKENVRLRDSLAIARRIIESIKGEAVAAAIDAATESETKP